MKITKILGFVTILLLGIGAGAQEFPRTEIGINYSYARFNPAGGSLKGHSFNGGGGSATININEYLGIKMDLQGLTSNKTGFDLPASATFPNGLSGNVQGNMFTYLFGPQLKVRTPRFQPYGHLLFGGAHTNVYGNAFQTLCQPIAGGCTITKQPTTEAFAMEFGGGIDIPLSKSIQFRPVEIDYFLTRYTNAFTKTNNQNNFRYSVGLVFTLGHTQQ